MSYDLAVWNAAVTLDNEAWREFERTQCVTVSEELAWAELSEGTLE